MQKKTPAARKDTERLSELMFEMGRLLKHQMSVDGYGPSFYLHLETLRYLAEHPSADMRDIAGYLRIAAPSATGLANLLVKTGLIARKADSEDRRRVRIALTKKGENTLKNAARHRRAAFIRVTAPLSAADRAELVRILSVITHRS